MASTLYNDTVLDHYQHPRNVGVLEEANALGQAENAACGDELQLYLQIQGERVLRARFRTFGCAASIAAGSMLTQLVTGASLDQVRQITSEDIAAALGGLPPLKAHASALAADSLQDALEAYRRRTDSSDPITQTSR